MRLLQRLKMAFWQSDLAKRLTDWRGDTGRVYSHQVLTSEGGLLTVQKLVTTAGYGGLDVTFGQGVTPPVAGYSGRPSVLDATSSAAEWDVVQQ